LETRKVPPERYAAREKCGGPGSVIWRDWRPWAHPASMCATGAIRQFLREESPRVHSAALWAMGGMGRIRSTHSWQALFGAWRVQKIVAQMGFRRRHLASETG